MTCELCGKEIGGCKPAMVDGVKMMLCPNCIRHGEALTPVARAPSHVKKFVAKRARSSQRKDIFKGMEKELVANWSEVIKKARLKKGLSREQLGFKIGERTVTISKIENGDLRPSDKMIAKLEKELEISLLEVVKDVSTQKDRSFSSGMTLGDFVRTE